MNVAFNWQEGRSSAALQSWRETGRYEPGIRVGPAHLAKPPATRGCSRWPGVPSRSWGCGRRARVVSLTKAEAAGEPGDRPASDSASPDLCPRGQAIFGSGCV